MPEKKPARLIAYFLALPVFCGSFFAALYYYFLIPYFSRINYDYYNVILYMLVALAVTAFLSLFLSLLRINHALREKLRKPYEFIVFLFVSILIYFILVFSLVSPTTIVLGKKIPEARKYQIKQSKPLLIDNIAALDLDNGVVANNTRVLIDNGRIKRIGTALDIEIPSDAKIINGEGKMLLPGLIDAHVHLGLSGKMESWYRSFFVESLEQRMERNARLTLESGVTTVREMPDYYLSSVGLKHAINQGRVFGPRMFTSGKAIARFGGYYGWPAFGHFCTTPSDVQRAIDYNVKKGSDFIVITTPDSTFLKAGEKDMNDRLIEAAVEQARSQDLKISAHVMWAEGTSSALKYGVDGFEHLPSIMEPVQSGIVENVLREGAYVVPTAYMYKHLNDIINDPEMIENEEYQKRFGPSYKTALAYTKELNDAANSNDAVSRKMSEILNKAVMEDHKSNFKKMLKAGATFGLGTGAGDYLMPHGWISKELEQYIEYGMSPMEAINAATYNNAYIIGKEDEIGRINEGFKADLLIIDGDPIADIKDITKIEMVIKDGVIVYQK